MKVWAIRVNKKHKEYDSYHEAGVIWVDGSKELYTVKSKAHLYSSRKKAEADIEAPWEEVIDMRKYNK